MAVEMDHEDYRGWFTRGVTQRRLGNSREATADCQRGLELASISILSNPGLLDEILGPDVAKAIEELPDREQVGHACVILVAHLRMHCMGFWSGERRGDFCACFRFCLCFCVCSTGRSVRSPPP